MGGPNSETTPQPRQEGSISLNIATMDKMIENAGRTGKYFVTFGRKGPLEDGRALLLTSPVINEKGQELHIVITREEPYSFLVEDDRCKQALKEIIRKRLKDPSAINFDNDGFKVRQLGPYNQLERTFSCSDRLGREDQGEVFTFRLSAVDMDLVQKAIGESRMKAQTPETLETIAEKQRLQKAQALSTLIGELPPKST